MGWPFLFRQGFAYVAGFDRPRIVSLATIVEKVEAEGFDVALVAECGELPLPFETRGSCPDDWDFVALVVRTGPDREIDVPDRVWWIAEAASVGDGTTPPDVVAVTPRPLEADRAGKGAALTAGLALGTLGAGLAMLLGAPQKPGTALAGAALGGAAAAAWVTRW